MLRGWFGYFKHATPVDLETLDGFIRRRLGHSCTSRKTSTLPSSALSSIINDGGITSLPKLGCSHYPQQLAERDIPPMRKLLTGEPYAGNRPYGSGGRGANRPSVPQSEASLCGQQLEFICSGFLADRSDRYMWTPWLQPSPGCETCPQRRPERWMLVCRSRSVPACRSALFPG
jgi:hypothetical protein